MPDNELKAIATVVEALEGLDEDSRGRVLRYAEERYGQTLSRTRLDVSSQAPAVPERPDSAFSDVGDLVHATQASSGPERALAVAYWLQEIEGKPGWTGGELNNTLKNLGHGLANVTKTMDSLKARKPQLVMQVAKSGRSNQARKTYKLTTAGLHQVQSMLTGVSRGE